MRVRSANEIILNTIDTYRQSQPSLDLKPGTVARDLLVDGPAVQLSLLYQELARVRNIQSLGLAIGADLDRLGSNYGIGRKKGSVSSGSGLVTFKSIDGDVPITKGDIATANNGATFSIVNNVTVSSLLANTYRAIASKYRAELDFAGITDEYAVEVNLEATTVGIIGNISKYALITISSPGASNIINVQPFGGGSLPEDDATYRSRILSIFSGANTGTSLGYRERVRSDPAVLDAIVVGPGDTLMTRDGTQIVEDESGNKTIVSEGTGGKVDIYIFGTRLTEILDSFIYQDKSNKNDPTDTSNDFVLGQIEGDENKTVVRRRLENLADGVLPSQPVNNIISVTGSLSGANFITKSTDEFGRITGNYVLQRDTGSFTGSPWGFDKLHWVSDRISDFAEDITKGRFNGQDAVAYSDVLKISEINQNIQVINENGRVSSSNRSSIQLAHYPISTVTRVFNLTTGERYVVSDQNPDGDGSINETGRILIRGNTLPAVSDSLQIDYTWIYNYDPNFDFDNKLTNTNIRDSIDSIDWGFSNRVSREQKNVAVSGSLKTVTVTHPISSVISINTFTNETSSISLSSGKLCVIVASEVENVISIVRNSDNAELYDTSKSDGTFSGLTIFLPTDTVGEFNDSVTVTYNITDVFTINGVSGSFSDNIITLSSDTTITAGTTVECNYIANIKTILPAVTLSSLPYIRDDNNFKNSTTSGVGVQPFTNIYSSPGVVAQNLRQAPSRLALTISGSISPGVITVSGTTFLGVFNAILTAANTSLTHDLSSLVRSALSIKSTDSIPSNVNVVKIISVEKVTTASTNSSIAVSSDYSYDIRGYKLRSNSFAKSESVVDSLLSTTQFTLPATTDNESNIPSVGDKLQVTFYIAKTSDTENVSFTKSGTLYTNKTFALVDSVAISSGFTSGSSQTATLTVSNQNQPIAGSRYTVNYDYLAPKSNERITIRYNHNRLITDTTLDIENVRPISADVLLKAATPVLINVAMAIVVESGFTNSSSIVAQNVKDAIATALNATALRTIIDESDLINVAGGVDGVDRVRPISFNVDGEIGRVLSIEAGANEYLQANTITITVETR